ncbi:MAG: UDP-N-acetylmuramoyl-L-alanyl-D-glutamate--2,6-diaminopimelate ligase [Syntrophorhabdaceae bacterium]|nr:UDP-N-acetylmuramoyl-L-alanyl-D-glutamate--2,6-diaminopimelate ligase [Syntrophorhabdaceae bacterium]
MMKLKELIHELPYTSIEGDPDIDISKITKDSREVEEGTLFFVTGSNKLFIEDAKKRGAYGVVSSEKINIPFKCSIITEDPAYMLGHVASRFFGYPSRDMFVVGITGTNGKTTTSYLTESILKAGGKKTGLIGTIAYRFNGEVRKADNTTPGAETLHGLLKEMRDYGVEDVVMEVSSHALDQKRVEGIDFDVGIFTNLTHDHLDYHQTIENYMKAKRLLFTYHLDRSKKADKWAILNLDDPYVEAMKPEGHIKTFYYSIEKKAHAHLLAYEESIEGLKLKISLIGHTLSALSPLIGIFNASNILASSLAGYAAGIPFEMIVKGIETLPGVPGRLERVKNDKGISVFVDYAHTPDALKNVLTLLSRLKKGRLIVVFGCGGDRDRAKRPLMGEIATRYGDLVIITSDNPRREDPEKIIEEIKKGVRGNNFKVLVDRREAIKEGLNLTGEKDVLLVAGKGHEDYQIIGEKVFPFSDQETIREILSCGL